MESARGAAPHDNVRVAELARQARASATSQRGGARLVAGLALQEPLEEAFAAFIGRSDARVLVGCIDDVVVGYAVVRVVDVDPSTRVAVCDELYVEPEARAVGVGEALASELVGFAQEHRCGGLEAVALPGDRATKNFFEAQGLVARALVMHRALHPGD
ncbi:MAG: GNAT family N-acetyltransferase [Acidimicrobiia bacterium]